MEFTTPRPATQAFNQLRTPTRTPMKKFGLLLFALALGCDTDKFTTAPSATAFYFVRLDPPAASVGVGETKQVSVTAFDAGPCGGAPCSPFTPGNPITVQQTPTFRSTDPTRATVSSTGLVTGVAVGSASIIATLQNAPGTVGGEAVTLADTTVFTVTAAPVQLGGLALSGRSTGTPNTVAAGTTLTLTTTTTDANGASLGTTVGRPQYYSTRPDIATVNATGVVTGVAPGNTTILASITVGPTTRTASYDVTVTAPVAATISICGQACQGAPVTGIAFIPGTTTVSATQAQVQGLPGATITFTVPNNTFTATTTPNNTQCFNVTFANPGAAGPVPPATVGGDIGTGGAGSANPPLCSNTSGTARSVQRRFTTPGTYTFTSTTNGATGTIIVQ
jgi:hypothetical protein